MQQYLEAGKVVTTHGVRGEMKLELWCDGVDFLKKTGRLYASAKGGKCYNITSIRPQGQMATPARSSSSTPCAVTLSTAATRSSMSPTSPISMTSSSRRARRRVPP